MSQTILARNDDSFIPNLANVHDVCMNIAFTGLHIWTGETYSLLWKFNLKQLKPAHDVLEPDLTDLDLSVRIGFVKDKLNLEH